MDIKHRTKDSNYYNSYGRDEAKKRVIAGSEMMKTFNIYDYSFQTIQRMESEIEALYQQFETSNTVRLADKAGDESLKNISEIFDQFNISVCHKWHALQSQIMLFKT